MAKVDVVTFLKVIFGLGDLIKRIYILVMWGVCGVMRRERDIIQSFVNSFDVLNIDIIELRELKRGTIVRVFPSTHGL